MDRTLGRVKKEHYYRLEDSDFAEAAGADLEGEKPQNPYAEDHAKPTGTDGKME